MTYLPTTTLKPSDTALSDPFGRMRVSEPYTIFDSKQTVSKAANYFDEVLAGGATSTHVPGDALTEMAVSTTGDYAIRQTFMRFNYQPGKGQLIFLTGVLGEPVASTESRIGYFNTSTSAPYTADRDGIYFGQDGTDVYVAISKTGTENKIVQSSWNLDPMDGTGPSGITADFDTAQIFVIDFEWLGVGRVRAGLVIDGIFYYVHEFNHANSVTAPYMSTPNHSIRYEVRSTGGVLTIKHICASVQSEGGIEPTGNTRGVSTGITTQSISTTPEGVLGIRLKSTALCSTIVIHNISVISTTDENAQIQLCRNPTYADTPSWTSAGDSSPFEYAIGSGTNEISAIGEVLEVYYTSSSENNLGVDSNPIMNPGVALDGTRDEFWLVITSTAPGSFLGGMNVRELSCG